MRACPLNDAAATSGPEKRKLAPMQLNASSACSLHMNPAEEKLKTDILPNARSGKARLHDEPVGSCVG